MEQGSRHPLHPPDGSEDRLDPMGATEHRSPDSWQVWWQAAATLEEVTLPGGEAGAEGQWLRPRAAAAGRGGL